MQGMPGGPSPLLALLETDPLLDWTTMLSTYGRKEFSPMSPLASSPP